MEYNIRKAGNPDQFKNKNKIKTLLQNSQINHPIFGKSALINTINWTLVKCHTWTQVFYNLLEWSKSKISSQECKHHIKWKIKRSFMEEKFKR